MTTTVVYDTNGEFSLRSGSQTIYEVQ